MALTPTQVNAHLRLILEEGFRRFLLTCRDYAAAGGPDEKEAARLIAREAYERVIGHPPTTADIHVLQKHRVGTGGDLL